MCQQEGRWQAKEPHKIHGRKIELSFLATRKGNAREMLLHFEIPGCAQMEVSLLLLANLYCGTPCLSQTSEI